MYLTISPAHTASHTNNLYTLVTHLLVNKNTFSHYKVVTVPQYNGIISMIYSLDLLKYFIPLITTTIVGRNSNLLVHCLRCLSTLK